MFLCVGGIDVLTTLWENKKPFLSERLLIVFQRSLKNEDGVLSFVQRPVLKGITYFLYQGLFL
jgi:hypothetical protein